MFSVFKVVSLSSWSDCISKSVLKALMVPSRLFNWLYEFVTCDTQSKLMESLFADASCLWSKRTQRHLASSLNIG